MELSGHSLPIPKVRKITQKTYHDPQVKRSYHPFFGFEWLNAGKYPRHNFFQATMLRLGIFLAMLAFSFGHWCKRSSYALTFDRG